MEVAFEADFRILLGVGIDTYLVIPVASPRKAKEAFLADQLTHVGRDYLVLYCGERYAEVEAEPEVWGARYAADLPAEIRKGLDPRGLLASPEVGQAFNQRTYAEVVAGHDPPLFLPVKREPRSDKRQRRLLLVSLSPAREKMLMAEPELLRDLLEQRKQGKIPGLLELDDAWIELQKALFDFAWHTQVEEATAEALVPRKGLLLCQDKQIDGARIIPTEQARTIGTWLLKTPADLVAQVSRLPAQSPASRAYPGSLGTSPSDDSAPLRAGRTRSASPRFDAAKLSTELERLRGFFGDVLRAKHAIASVRFRE